MAYTAANHQVANELHWLHFWGAAMLYAFIIYSLLSLQLEIYITTTKYCNTFISEWSAQSPYELEEIYLNEKLECVAYTRGKSPGVILLYS